MVLAAGIFFCLGGAVLVRHSGFDPESVEGGGRGGQTLSQAQGDRLAVAAVGKKAVACCFCGAAGACWRWQLWASKQGHASFAERRLLAVSGLGEFAGACCFLQSGACLRWRVWVSWRGHVVFLQRGACWRLRVWARKPGHASFAERRLFAVSGLGEFAVICFVYKSAFVGGSSWGCTDPESSSG